MPEYLITSGLPSYPAALTDKEVSMVLPLYRAVNNLANKVSAITGHQQFTASDLASINPFDVLLNVRTNKVFAVATEALSYGMVVNIYDNAGTVSCRKADRATSKAAHGVVNNTAGATIGQVCEILFMEGRTQGISGSTLGTPYYLGNAGTVTSPKPTTGFIQAVGWGLGSDGFYLNIEAP